MRAIHSLQALTGIYVLSGDAALGVYDGSQNFSVDSKLNAAFAEHNAAYLKSYLMNPDDGNRRIGIIYTSNEATPWKGASFVAEEWVVRTLYPVSGARTMELTGFQRRHQTQSFSRGMEALLGFGEASDVTDIYCPVLFDRHTTLDYYLPLLRREERESDKQTPVMEVLDLVATLSKTARTQPVILDLRNRLRQALVDSGLRESSKLSVLDKVEWQTDDTDSTYAGADKRHSRSVMYSAVDLNSLHSDHCVEEVERWLPQPPRAVDPMVLREFEHFKGVDERRLDTLASKCFIYEAPAGTRLVQRGMDDEWNMYLLSGSVALDPEDGSVIVVDGGTKKAESAISFLKPRKYTVDTLTPVSFLWIHDALIEVLFHGDLV
jgi:uncharacterized cupin superfamily protein